MLNIDLADFTSEPDTTSMPGTVFKWLSLSSDHFTGFITGAYAMTSKASKEVAFRLLPSFGAFGPPLILIADNGPEFHGHFGDAISEVWTRTKVVHIRPRNPKANGAAENNVKIVKCLLWRIKMSYAMDDPRRLQWALHLPEAQRSYNEAVSRYRGTSPHMLVFGRLPVSHMHDSIEAAGFNVGEIAAIEDQEERVAALHEVRERKILLPCDLHLTDPILISPPSMSLRRRFERQG